MAERRQSDILYFVYLMLQLYQQVGSLVRFHPSISSSLQAARDDCVALLLVLIYVLEGQFPLMITKCNPYSVFSYG